MLPRMKSADFEFTTIAQVAPEEIDGSGADALQAQLVIEAAIESWQTGTVVTL